MESHVLHPKNLRDFQVSPSPLGIMSHYQLSLQYDSKVHWFDHGSLQMCEYKYTETTTIGLWA